MHISSPVHHLPGQLDSVHDVLDEVSANYLTSAQHSSILHDPYVTLIDLDWP